MHILERMQAKHKSVVDDLAKLKDRRDKALDTLLKAELRHRAAIKAVVRSTKRLDKAREEERQAKLARKAARTESQKEMPDIGRVMLGG